MSSASQSYHTRLKNTAIPGIEISDKENVTAIARVPKHPKERSLEDYINHTNFKHQKSDRLQSESSSSISVSTIQPEQLKDHETISTAQLEARTRHSMTELLVSAEFEAVFSALDLTLQCGNIRFRPDKTRQQIFELLRK